MTLSNARVWQMTNPKKTAIHSISHSYDTTFTAIATGVRLHVEADVEFSTHAPISQLIVRVLIAPECNGGCSRVARLRCDS